MQLIIDKTLIELLRDAEQRFLRLNRKKPLYAAFQAYKFGMKNVKVYVVKRVFYVTI
jgi:hypothetical protein